MQSQGYNKSENSYYEGEHFSAWQVMDWFTDHLKGVNAFNACNVIKYLLRYDRKGTPKQDLQKALNYMNNFYADDWYDFMYKDSYIIPEIIDDFKRNKSDKEFEIWSNTFTDFMYAMINGCDDGIEDAKAYLQLLIETVGE